MSEERKKILIGKLDESILLVNTNSGLQVLDNLCPNDCKSELSNGFLSDYLIKCPIDGSSFDIKTGGCEFGPSLNALNKYDVINEEGKYYAMVNTQVLNKSKFFNMVKRDPKNTKRFVIIGGGIAGLSCAETLRQAGFTGEIIIYSEEPFLAYNRSFLSKDLKADLSKLILRDNLFLEQYDIQLIPNTKVVYVNNTNKLIKLNNGSSTVSKMLILMLVL